VGDEEASAGKVCQNILVRIVTSVIHSSLIDFQENRLGISVESSQVRLITNGDGSYTWAALPGKEHPFSKHMSEHSIEAYKKLCEGIEVTFKALPVTAEQNSADCLQEKTLSIYTRNIEAQVSFSAKIAELQEESKSLARELSQWRDQANAESELRRRAQAETDKSDYDS